MGKTIEILPETADSVLCLRFSGIITAEDFINELENPLLQIIEKYGHYSMYIDYSPAFIKWSPEAADLSFKCITACGPKVRRCAYVNPPQERLLMMKLLNPITTNADVRYFNNGEQQIALDWIRGP
jgi:hypothetical protein